RDAGSPAALGDPTRERRDPRISAHSHCDPTIVSANAPLSVLQTTPRPSWPDLGDLAVETQRRGTGADPLPARLPVAGVVVLPPRRDRLLVVACAVGAARELADAQHRPVSVRARM